MAGRSHPGDEGSESGSTGMFTQQIQIIAPIISQLFQGDLVWVDLNPASKWSILEENIRDYLDAKKKAGQVLTEEDLALALGAQLQISDSEKKVKVVEAAETKINDQKIAPIASEVKAESQVNGNKVEEEEGTKKKKTRRGKRKKKSATTVATNEEEEAKENEEPSQPIEEPAITVNTRINALEEIK